MKSRKRISIIVAMAMVLSLFAAMPMTASAATGMATIPVNTLTADADNSGDVATASQWAYNHATKALVLSTVGGNYTLTGNNTDLTVYVDRAAIDANITLGNAGVGVSIGVLQTEADCTVTLVGTNTMGTPTGFAFNVYPSQVGDSVDCTINGSGNLTASSNLYGILIKPNSNLSIAGTATVTGTSTNGSGIVCNDNSTISVGTGAMLGANGSVSGIRGDGNLTLTGGGEIYANDSGTGVGISMAANKNITLDGGIYVSATGGAGKKALDMSGTGKVIFADDAPNLWVENNSASDERIKLSKSSTTLPWWLSGTGAMSYITSGNGNATDITISLPAGKNGNINIDSGGVRPYISTSAGTLTSGTVGTVYSTTITAVQGRDPITSWDVYSGTLPGGLILNNNGTITGTPTTAGTYTFRISVNAFGQSYPVQYSITISTAGGGGGGGGGSTYTPSNPTGSFSGGNSTFEIGSGNMTPFT